MWSATSHVFNTLIRKPTVIAMPKILVGRGVAVRTTAKAISGRGLGHWELFSISLQARYSKWQCRCSKDRYYIFQKVFRQGNQCPLQVSAVINVICFLLYDWTGLCQPSTQFTQIQHMPALTCYFITPQIIYLLLDLKILVVKIVLLLILVTILKVSQSYNPS